MQKEEFESFFKPYAKNVDNANKHGFWKLSDDLILEIIKRNINNVSENSIILDAGGGTGRWVCDLAKIYKSNFIVYDLSEDMLIRAKENIKQASIENRVDLIHGDLLNMKEIESNSIDNIISIYSPISFIDNKNKFFSEIYRILKKGGKAIIMGHGFYNALYSKINNYCANPNELDKLENTQIVKWAEYVPELSTFSKEIMEKGMENAGFTVDKTYGIPVFAQPGPEDFDPKNKQKSKISIALEDAEFRNKVFEIEMKYNSLPSVSNRGMNIFTVGIKI